MDLRKIKTLIDLVQQSGISELEITEGEERVRISRHAAPGAYAPAPMPASTFVLPPDTAGSSSSVALGPTEPTGHTLKSPMVGTFYNKPNPNSKPFVEVGSNVLADTPVCMIEAMKVFNEIPAEVRGKIVGVLVQNEEAVDFGRPLFKVDTHG